MNTQSNRMKQRDAQNIIENNNLCTISCCQNGQPYCCPMYYDTDSYCGCIRILIRSKNCGVLIDCIKANPKVCVSIINSGSSSWCGNQRSTRSVCVLGTATLVEDDLDCCNPRPGCYLTIEVEPTCITGHIIED